MRCLTMFKISSKCQYVPSLSIFYSSFYSIVKHRLHVGVIRDCTSITLSISKTCKTSGQCFKDNAILGSVSIKCNHCYETDCMVPEVLNKIEVIIFVMQYLYRSYLIVLRLFRDMNNRFSVFQGEAIHVLDAVDIPELTTRPV